MELRSREKSLLPPSMSTNKEASALKVDGMGRAGCGGEKRNDRGGTIIVLKLMLLKIEGNRKAVVI